MMAKQSTARQATSQRPPADVEGFGSSAPTTVTTQPSDRAAITTSVATAVEQEIRGAIILAHQFPRSEDGARQKLLLAASRRLFADECTYEFPRGDTTVKGPSIKMAREFARVWGNIRFGVKITQDDEDTRSIVGWAWDLEANSYEECPDTFRKLIQRKGKGWVVPDERDLRELTFRRAAICVRNCIIHLIPSDLLADIIDKAAATLRTNAGDADKLRKDIIDGFTMLNVPVAELESLMGHALGSCSPAELDRLKGIWKTIKAGDASWVDYYRNMESVRTDSGKSAAFGGNVKGQSVERPHQTNQPADDKRTCLPTHLQQSNDDKRTLPEFLVAIIPGCTAGDLDAITAALPGLKLGRDQMQIVQAISTAREAIPKTDETATAAAPYPEAVLTFLDELAVAKTEMAVLQCKQKWLSIRSQHADFDAEVNSAIGDRMEQVKK